VIKLIDKERRIWGICPYIRWWWDDLRMEVGLVEQDRHVLSPTTHNYYQTTKQNNNTPHSSFLISSIFSYYQ